MAQKSGAKQRLKNRKLQLASFFGTQQRLPRSSSKKPADVSTENSEPKPIAAHVFSGRFILGLIALAIVGFVAYAPISTFITQQQEINQVKSHISDLEGENQDLQTQLSWWKDDNYVKQQAKDRLFFVTEGETPYLVTGADFTSDVADDTSAAAKESSQDSWTNTLWDSLQQSSLDGYEEHPGQVITETQDSATNSPGASATE